MHRRRLEHLLENEKLRLLKVLEPVVDYYGYIPIPLAESPWAMVGLMLAFKDHVIDYAYNGMLTVEYPGKSTLYIRKENYDSTSRSAASDDGEANDGEPEPFHKFNLPDEWW
jgi:hypothetical protein